MFFRSRAAGLPELFEWPRVSQEQREGKKAATQRDSANTETQKNKKHTLKKNTGEKVYN